MADNGEIYRNGEKKNMVYFIWYYSKALYDGILRVDWQFY